MGVEEIGRAARGLRAPDGARLLRQTYEPDRLPAGVILVPQRVTPEDWGGSFKEVVRLSDGAVAAPALREHGVVLRPAQVNVSVAAPGTRKFWHLHPTQSELWAPAAGQLSAGLIDCREGSPTYGLRTKVVLTPERALFLPPGVAHGYANETAAPAVLLYLVDRHWSPGEDSEEWRLDATALSYDFVLAKAD